MTCSDCLHSAVCTQTVSSNGHTTWCTPIFLEDDPYKVTGGDLEGISAPEVSPIHGGMVCASFEWEPNSRPCQCGSGEPWTTCSASLPECG